MKNLKAFNELNEDHNENKNYMVIGNLEKIQRLSTAMLEKIKASPDELDEWAKDHIATSADDIEEVFNFLWSDK